MAKHLQEIRRDMLKAYQHLVEGFVSATAEQNESWFFGAWRNAQDLASLAYAFEEPITEVKALLNASCDHALQCVDFGYPIHIGWFVMFLSGANICNHRPLQDRPRGIDPIGLHAIGPEGR